jgi:hypothetical protein
MGIRVSSDQQHLKKQHARGPHRRGPAKPWQNVFAKQKLHPEEKKRTEKNRYSKWSFCGANARTYSHEIPESMIPGKRFTCPAYRQDSI